MHYCSWGTPQVADLHLHFMPLTTTPWGFPCSWFSSHLTVCSSSPYLIRYPSLGQSCSSVQWLTEFQADIVTVLPSSTRTDISSQKFIKLVKHDFSLKNPCWLLLLPLEMFVSHFLMWDNESGNFIFAYILICNSTYHWHEIFYKSCTTDDIVYFFSFSLCSLHLWWPLQFLIIISCICFMYPAPSERTLFIFSIFKALQQCMLQ